MSTPKVYIAGPMTGMPNFNYPAFNEAAAKLRALGLDVVSPAELDSPEMQALAMQSTDGNLAWMEAKSGETWGDVLARDVKLISDQGVTHIALLPNWEKSRGARLESFVGLLNRVHFYLYMRTDNERLSPLVPVSRREILNEIAASFQYQPGLNSRPGE